SFSPSSNEKTLSDLWAALDPGFLPPYNLAMLSRLHPGPPRLSAFLFDLDGTLVETPIDFAGMRRGVLDLARSLDLDADALLQYDILGIIEQAEAQLEGVPLAEPFRQQAERLLTRYEVEAASVAKELPGAIATLTQL